ncbi:MAG: hypothetical protein V5A68_06925 [Candidatus Thermoplasmatota archaeon]
MKGKKRERILRILLDNPNGDLTAYAVHKKAECSQPWALTYIKKLENMDFVKKTKVVDVYGLYEYWLKIRHPLNYSEYHLKKNPISMIKDSKLSYALTTYQADRIIHNYLFPSRTDFYILKEDFDSWHKRLLSNGLVGKGNTRIIIADPHLIKNSIKRQGFHLVSKSQLICDLLLEGGVAKDAADRLIRK